MIEECVGTVGETRVHWTIVCSICPHRRESKALRRRVGTTIFLPKGLLTGDWVCGSWCPKWLHARGKTLSEQKQHPKNSALAITGPLDSNDFLVNFVSPPLQWPQLPMCPPDLTRLKLAIESSFFFPTDASLEILTCRT